jgi:hypothetical protein
MTREQRKAWAKTNPEKGHMTWNYFAAKWFNQFHPGWLTPLLRARGRFNATEAFVAPLGIPCRADLPILSDA